jgi:hypothetical protein
VRDSRKYLDRRYVQDPASHPIPMYELTAITFSCTNSGGLVCRKSGNGTIDLGWTVSPAVSMITIRLTTLTI